MPRAGRAKRNCVTHRSARMGLLMVAGLAIVAVCCVVVVELAEMVVRRRGACVGFDGCSTEAGAFQGS